MKESVIICVDDEDIVVKSLKRELKKAFGEEYIIETAESGAEALELVEELLDEGHEIPVIISDHIMPDLKGDELLQRVHECSPKTLKIMLTGQADLQAVTNAVNNAELYHYIAKPWENTNLILTVKGAIHRYNQDKQLEEQNAILQNMNSVLEQQVKERTRELELANASKDKFFSILAHDLRAPFNGLIGMTEIFSENIGKNTFNQNDMKTGMDSLGKTAKTVYSLLENLLTWSRLQRGAIEFFPQELLLEQTVDEVLDIFESNTQQKQIRLSNKIPAPTPVYADVNMLNTILRNLVSNALKFTHEGGQIEVSAEAHEEEEYVEVCVSDTGVGMSPEDQQKLFRIDVKHSDVGTAGEKGTGLGLILCKELVEQNGGAIRVESEPGAGARFLFTIPAPPF